MTSRFTPNAALLVDAAGCFIGSCIFLLSETAWGWTDLPGGWRQPVVAALFVFNVLLVIAARYASRPLITAAVIGNIAWIIGGAIALFVTGTVLGGAIIGVVMLADAVMAWLQARLLTAETLSQATTPTIE